MKRVVLVLVVSMAGACTASQPGPSCKDAVEKAGSATDLRAHDVTMAIGECEQQGWSLDARKCIAAVHASADVTKCGGTFKLGERGIFGDPNRSKRVMAEMARIRDQMCACKDMACAQHVSEELTKFGQQEARDNPDPPKLTEEETKQLTQTGEDMGRYMQKTMNGATP